MPAALVVFNALARHPTARTERREAIESVEPALKVVKRVVNFRLADALLRRLPERLQYIWIEYLRRIQRAEAVWMSAMKSIDFTVITGRHSVDGAEALSPNVDTCSGGAARTGHEGPKRELKW